MHAYRTTEFMHGREAGGRVDIFENQPPTKHRNPTYPLLSVFPLHHQCSLFSNKKRPVNFAFFFLFDFCTFFKINEHVSIF